MVGVYELLMTGRIKKKSLDVCCGKRKIETYAERHLLVEISRKTGYDLIRGRDVVKHRDLFSCTCPRHKKQERRGAPVHTSYSDFNLRTSSSERSVVRHIKSTDRPSLSIFFAISRRSSVLPSASPSSLA